MNKATLILTAVFLVGPAWNDRAVDFQVKNASELQSALEPEPWNQKVY